VVERDKLASGCVDGQVCDGNVREHAIVSPKDFLVRDRDQPGGVPIETNLALLEGEFATILSDNLGCVVVQEYIAHIGARGRLRARFDSKKALGCRTRKAERRLNGP
jgi:hypothetical protein